MYRICITTDFVHFVGTKLWLVRTRVIVTRFSAGVGFRFLQCKDYLLYSIYLIFEIFCRRYLICSPRYLVLHNTKVALKAVLAMQDCNT